MMGFFFSSLLGTTLISSSVVFVFMAAFVCLKKKKPANWLRIAAISLFAGYVIGILTLTLEPRFIAENGLAFDPSDYNFVPFRQIKTWIKYLEYAHTKVNFWGNIFCFSPIGFAVSLFRRYKWPVFAGTLCTGLFSVFIELFQLFLPRMTDVDDVILNTLGGFIGALIYLAFRRFLPKLDEIIKTPT